MNETPPDFEVLNELLDRDQLSLDAAELQGSLCAQLSAAGPIDIQQWVNNALGAEAELSTLGESTRGALGELFDWTRASLMDEGMGFKLFLPDDTAPLAMRTQSLAFWCAGYLHGLGMAGIGQAAALPEDAQEFLIDVGDISRASFEVEEGESDEVAYMELVEYTRVGAMLMFETLRGPEDSESIH